MMEVGPARGMAERPVGEAAVGVFQHRAEAEPQAPARGQPGGGKRASRIRTAPSRRQRIAGSGNGGAAAAWR